MTAPTTLTWDESAIAQAKAQDYLEAGIASTDKEAFEMVISDSELLEFEYEDFLEDFGAILKHISKDGLFYIEGRNMGWRRLSGHIGLEATNARDFIARSFPRTSEWTLRGKYDRRRRILTFTLFHHDAPTGEYYTLKRGYPRLTVLSARSPEKLVAAQKKTWLDTELQQQAKGKHSLSSYDVKLLQALEERKKWLVEKDLGVIQSNGEFALRTGALKKLDRMEVYAAGELLAGKLGLKFNDQMVQEGVAMRFEDDIQLETGTWAVVSKGRSLHMMPVDEQSKAVSGQQVTFRQLESGKFEAQPAKARSQSRDRDKDQEMEL